MPSSCCTWNDVEGWILSSLPSKLHGTDSTAGALTLQPVRVSPHVYTPPAASVCTCMYTRTHDFYNYNQALRHASCGQIWLPHHQTSRNAYRSSRATCPVQILHRLSATERVIPDTLNWFIWLILVHQIPQPGPGSTACH